MVECSLHIFPFRVFYWERYAVGIHHSMHAFIQRLTAWYHRQRFDVTLEFSAYFLALYDIIRSKYCKNPYNIHCHLIDIESKVNILQQTLDSIACCVVDTSVLM